MLQIYKQVQMLFLTLFNYLLFKLERVRICTSHTGFILHSSEFLRPLRLEPLFRRVVSTLACPPTVYCCIPVDLYLCLLLPFQVLPAVTCAPVIRCTQARVTSLFTLRRSDGCLFHHRSIGINLRLILDHFY